MSTTIVWRINDLLNIIFMVCPMPTVFSMTHLVANALKSHGCLVHSLTIFSASAICPFITSHLGDSRSHFKPMGTKIIPEPPIRKHNLQAASPKILRHTVAKKAPKGIPMVPQAIESAWYLPRVADGSISDIYTIATVTIPIVPKPVRKRQIINTA